MQTNVMKIDRRVVGDMLADPETSATSLHAVLLAFYKEDLYGDVALDIPPMDPVELWVRVREDFHVNAHENNENKINALQLAIATDAFYEDPLAFISICLALYDGDVGDMVTGALEEPTVAEVLWGIYEVELNRDDNQPFSPRVMEVIDETIAAEAEEQSEDPADILPGYERLLEFKRQKMFEEMRLLGWPESIIRRIAMGDITPRHDDDADIIQPTSEAAMLAV